MASFSTALSGLKADTTAIDVVGNNLANLNTTGFKASAVSFQDLVTQSIGAGLGATQVGFGVGIPITLRQFTQGAIQSTGGPLDAAIQGDGFFVVKSANATEYTRGGSFEVDTNGDLTTASGQFVQGWTAVNGVLDTNGPVGNITVPTGTLAAPVATTTLSAGLNLDASAAAGTTFSTSLQVYDSLGVAHIATLSFTKTGTANQWTYSGSIPATDTTSPSTPVTGTLTFDANGNLVTPAATDPQPVISAPGLADGANDLNITWNLWSANGATPDITQYAQTSASSAQAQNGSAAANLVSVGLANGGIVLAQYSDGTQVAVGQMALAVIRNPASLIAAGESNYLPSALTALPAIGVPGSGGRGTVLGGSVEGSTVDIATQFTNLIVYQRAYEANAHVVTTVDQLSQDTIALKQQ
ncbi:MAG TPA: flagellar hook protein FlgE [Bryobacteraceae bacterium]|nr:flagellar hook protein FlgE [Bryobacteraceae bacterium]